MVSSAVVRVFSAYQTRLGTCSICLVRGGQGIVTEKPRSRGRELEQTYCVVITFSLVKYM